MKHDVIRPCSAPCPAQGYLMDKIVGYGKTHVRCETFRLCPEGLCGMEEPLSLCDVTCAPQAPTYEQAGCGCRGEMTLEVTVPLVCTVRDACGRTRSACASVKCRLCIRAQCGLPECRQYGIRVQAYARLVGCARALCGGCFEAPLELLMEGYLTKPCVLRASGDCAPDCPPPKPWYPEPYRPSF